jgi:lysozyme
MKASDSLIEILKQFEGFRSKAYLDSVGVPTIAWGHTKGVKLGMKCDEEQGEKWLKEDIEPLENYLNTIPELDTQGKFDACIDFCYNLGIGNFKSSTLLKKIKNKASDSEICKQFRRWVYAGGKKLTGLVRRREAECELWIS